MTALPAGRALARDTAPVPSEARQSGDDAPTTGRHGAAWTAERLDVLHRGVADGLSCARIARLIGVSRNAVIGKVNRLGIARGRTPTITVERSLAPRLPRNPRVLAPRRETPPRPPTPRQVLRFVRRDATPAPVALSAEACSLLDLAPGQCRWPMDAGPALTFCGRPRLAALSYCPGHAQLAYRPPAARRS